MTTGYKEDAKSKTVELTINGKVTKDEFNQIATQMDAFIATHGKIKVLEIVDDFDGFDPSILIEGLKFDMKHLKNISHCAVVAEDNGLISSVVKAVKIFNDAAGGIIPCEVKLFDKDDLDDARKWLKAQNTPKGP